MRAFVFFLILANLLFLAWAQGSLWGASNPDALRVQQQLLADRVRVVARDEAPADHDAKVATVTEQKVEAGTPVEKVSDKVPDKVAEKVAEKSAHEAKPVEACLQLAEMPVADVTRAESLVAEKSSEIKAVRTVTREGSASYWVYIPPLATRRDAENKVSELKKLQVNDYFIVQENGPNNRAISLGLFSTREAAESYLESLRGKKVRSAQITEKNAKPALAALELRGPEAVLGPLGKTLAETLPDSRPAACKTTP